MIAKTNIAAVWLALAIFAAPSGAGEVLANARYGQFRAETLISGTPTTISNLEKLYRTYIGHADRIVVLRVFRSFQDFQQISAAYAHSDTGYAWWLEQYKTESRLPPPDVGEIIKIGNDVVARSLHAGDYQTKILHGSDPLQCWHGSNDCRILWMDVLGDVQGPEQTHVHARLLLHIEQRPMPSVAQAASECFRLQRRLKTKRIFVYFRPNNWFMQEFAPIIYPFTRESRVADLAAARNAPQIACTVQTNQKSFSCSLEPIM